jgi:hypothetical protein
MKRVVTLPACEPDITPEDVRDPEDRPVDPARLEEVRDKMLDKTLADSYPASDPPSSIPDPHEDSFRLECLPRENQAA